jgi:DNA-binding MarR family transcriptional regulator
VITDEVDRWNDPPGAETATGTGVPADCLALAAGLRAQFRQLLYLLRTIGQDEQLSVAQVSTLNAVAERPRRVGELARLNGVRLPSATEQVARLEREGLVSRAKDPDELRAVVVSLTAKGRTVLAEVNARRDRLVGLRLAALDPAERRALAAALPVIARLGE